MQKHEIRILSVNWPILLHPTSYWIVISSLYFYSKASLTPSLLLFHAKKAKAKCFGLSIKITRKKHIQKSMHPIIAFPEFEDFANKYMNVFWLGNHHILLSLPIFSYSDLMILSWYKQKTPTLQQRSCVGFSPNFLHKCIIHIFHMTVILVHC